MCNDATNSSGLMVSERGSGTSGHTTWKGTWFSSLCNEDSVSAVCWELCSEKWFLECFKSQLVAPGRVAANCPCKGRKGLRAMGIDVIFGDGIK